MTIQHPFRFDLPFDDADLLRAIGGVIAQWSVFDLEFDRALWILRLAPAARDVSPAPPKKFGERLKLFKKSARACFSECPSLAEKLVTVAGEARTTSVLRNLIAHGKWAYGPDGLSAYHPDKHLVRTPLPVAHLVDLRERIAANHGLLVELTHLSPFRQRSPALTEEEFAALVWHYRTYWPPPPAPEPFGSTT